MINYELKISLFGVWMLVIHFDSKLILKLLKKSFQQHIVTSLVAQAQKGPFANEESYNVYCSALSGFYNLLDFHVQYIVFEAKQNQLFTLKQ